MRWAIEPFSMSNSEANWLRLIIGVDLRDVGDSIALRTWVIMSLALSAWSAIAPRLMLLGPAMLNCSM